MANDDDQPDVVDEEDTSSTAVRALEARRAAHGIPYSNLAELAQVDAGYLRATLKGKRKPSSTFMGRVGSALDRFDEEVGGQLLEDDPNELDLVEIEVASGTADFRVVVKGPVRDRDQIADTALRLMADFRARERAAQKGEIESSDD